MRRSALVLVVLVAACTGGGDDEAVDTTTTEAPTTTVVETTTTTSAPDPFTVPADPADIDEAYVEAVLAELERINGDALRLAVAEGLSPTIADLIESIFDAELTALQIDGLLDASATGYAGILRPPGDVVATVQSVNVVRSDCISADVLLDFSGVADGGVVDAPTRVELRPPRDGRTPNATPWVYALRDPSDDPSLLPAECV